MKVRKYLTWINVVKAVAGAIVAVISLWVLPLQVVAWAEGEKAEVVAHLEQQMEKTSFIQRGREEVIHSTQKATHDYDFYSLQAAMAESDLISLEQDEQAGVQLTATQQRKQRKLEKDLDTFLERKDEALGALQDTEDDHETK